MEKEAVVKATLVKLAAVAAGRGPVGEALYAELRGLKLGALRTRALVDKVGRRAGLRLIPSECLYARRPKVVLALRRVFEQEQLQGNHHTTHTHTHQC